MPGANGATGDGTAVEAPAAGGASGGVELPPLPGGGRLEVQPAAAKPGVIEPSTAWTKLRARLTELQHLGPGASAHLPELLEALHHEDGVARQRAAVILAQLGDTGVQKLLEVLAAEEVDARLAAAFGLARVIDKIGGDDLQRHAYTLADSLTHWLLYPEAQVRADGAEALGQLGVRAKHTIGNLLDLLQDDAWEVRRAAARSLGQVGAGFDAVGPLRERLTDPAQSVRREAIDALGLIGPDAAAAVPGLIKSLDDETWLLKSEAARALGRIGAAAQPAISKLQELLETSEEPSVRAEAATALGLLHAGGSRDKLREAAKSDESTVAEGAIRALGALGNLDTLTEELLISRASKGNWQIRMAAAEALGRAPLHHSGLKRDGAWDGRVGKREALLAAAQHRSPGVRASAAFAIGASKGAEEERLEALKALLKDSDPGVRGAAITGLGRLGPIAAPLLAEWLDSEHAEEWQAAMRQIRRAGSNAGPAVPALRQMLRDGDVHRKRRAVQALGYVGPAAAAATPDLIALLADDWYVESSLTALAAIGPGAKAALPTLEAMETRLRSEYETTDATQTQKRAQLSLALGLTRRARLSVSR